MTTYQHFSIHGIGIRTVVTDSIPETRTLWKEEREIDSWSSVSNPEQCEEEWYLLKKRWSAFRRTLPSDTMNGNTSPISSYEIQEICRGRFVPLTVEDLRNPNNEKICDKFADEINSFLKKWVR
tara:strand:- start:6709 stop:7080 length:372 start_codon:yes stop_codon:yes gene_type:complete